MDRPLLFGQLSPPRQALIRLCQSINYGSIEGLTVRSREPVLTDSPPLVLVDVQLNAEDKPRPEATHSDFVLSTELVRLVSLLDQLHRVNDDPVSDFNIGFLNWLLGALVGAGCRKISAHRSWYPEQELERRIALCGCHS